MKINVYRYGKVNSSFLGGYYWNSSEFLVPIRQVHRIEMERAAQVYAYNWGYSGDGCAVQRVAVLDVPDGATTVTLRLTESDGESLEYSILEASDILRDAPPRGTVLARILVDEVDFSERYINTLGAYIGEEIRRERER